MDETLRNSEQQGQFDELVNALAVVTSRLPFMEMGGVLDSIFSRMPEEDRRSLRLEIGSRYDASDGAAPYRRMVDYLSPPPGGS